MKPPGRRMVELAILRLAAVLAVVGVSYTAATLFGIDPLGPALIASLILLGKLAMTHQPDDAD